MKKVALLLVLIGFFTSSFALECPPKTALSRISGTWTLLSTYTDAGWLALNYIDNVGLEKYTDIMSTSSLADDNIYLQVVITKYPENPKYTLECTYRNKGTEPKDIIVTVGQRAHTDIDFDPAKHKDFYPAPSLSPVDAYICVVNKPGDCSI